MEKFFSKSVLNERKKLIESISNFEGSFSSNFENIESNLVEDFLNLKNNKLIDHLRLCGNIPETIKHDSSQEKLYSKYTDLLISIAFKKIGLKSNIILSRSDVADVECYSRKFSFVADAKSFRLSRTAKNQKDFKIQALDRWKHGKPYALLVCPIHQLPSKNSQIYLQAITRDVCIFTYSHLVLLLKYSEERGSKDTELLLHKIFKAISLLNPSKSAVDYWMGINKTILTHNKSLNPIWKNEKLASLQSLEYAKKEALEFLALERERIMSLSHEHAINELIKSSNIDKKIKTINKISDNGLFEINGT